MVMKISGPIEILGLYTTILLIFTRPYFGCRISSGRGFSGGLGITQKEAVFGPFLFFLSFSFLEISYCYTKVPLHPVGHHHTLGAGLVAGATSAGACRAVSIELVCMFYSQSCCFSKTPTHLLAPQRLPLKPNLRGEAVSGGGSRLGRSLRAGQSAF